MDEIKQIVAKNIIRLRHAQGMTQMELAEKLNYSDKAVSKWERGDSLPDVTVLKNIADLFQVKIDDLITDSGEESPEPLPKDNRKLRNHGFITGMSILLVWLLATLAYVLIDLIWPGTKNHWLAFVCAVPVSMIVWLVFNSIWFNVRRNFLIISLLMWSIFATLCIAFQPYGFNIWLILAVGVPGQAIICLWSRIRGKKA